MRLENVTFSRDINHYSLINVHFSSEALPETWNKPIVYQAGIRGPSRIQSEYTFLGMDAVNQGCPAGDHQQNCDGTPLLEVKPDVRNDVGQIHRMPNDPVGALCHQAA